MAASKRAVVQQILVELKMDHLPRLTAYNKMDRLSPTQKRRLANALGLAYFPPAKGERLRGQFSPSRRKKAHQPMDLKKKFLSHTRITNG